MLPIIADEVYEYAVSALQTLKEKKKTKKQKQIKEKQKRKRNQESCVIFPT